MAEEVYPGFTNEESFEYFKSELKKDLEQTDSKVTERILMGLLVLLECLVIDPDDEDTN